MCGGIADSFGEMAVALECRISIDLMGQVARSFAALRGTSQFSWAADSTDSTY